MLKMHLIISAYKSVNVFSDNTISSFVVLLIPQLFKKKTTLFGNICICADAQLNCLNFY